MKITVKRPTEIEVQYIKVVLPVRYGEEDIPNNFPLRRKTVPGKYDVWEAKIAIDTGRIIEWPQGPTGELHMKVCDSGYYALISDKDEVIAELEDYVPSCIPGSDSDYVELSIDANGFITNWNAKSFSEFFPNE